MLKVTKTAAGDMKIIYKDKSYILPLEVYNLLVQIITIEILKDAKH